MSSGITEIALLPLKAGSNVLDPNTPEGTVVQESLATVLGQPGCQRAFWGVQEEDKSMMHWFVDWDSLDAHKTFMNSRYDLMHFLTCTEAWVSLTDRVLLS